MGKQARLKYPRRGARRLEQPRERGKPVLDWTPPAEWLADGDDGDDYQREGEYEPE